MDWTEDIQRSLWSTIAGATTGTSYLIRETGTVSISLFNTDNLAEIVMAFVTASVGYLGVQLMAFLLKRICKKIKKE